MKQKYIFTFLFLLALLGLYGWQRQASKRFEETALLEEERPTIQTTLLKAPDRQQVPLKIGQKEFTVEVVNSNETRMLGLSGRDVLGSDGMLFVFPQKSFQQFWMKDMRFDLDFIWISEERVIEIMHDIPAPKAGVTSDQLPKYAPHTPIEMILEVVAGKSDEWGIHVGDEVSLQ